MVTVSLTGRHVQGGNMASSCGMGLGAPASRARPPHATSPASLSLLCHRLEWGCFLLYVGYSPLLFQRCREEGSEKAVLRQGPLLGMQPQESTSAPGLPGSWSQQQAQAVPFRDPPRARGGSCSPLPP